MNEKTTKQDIEDLEIIIHNVLQECTDEDTMEDVFKKIDAVLEKIKK